MRYAASEKLEIIRTVETSHLPVRRTPKTTFYAWLDRYAAGGFEALEDRKPRPRRIWNRIPDEIRDKVIERALDEPELSPREVAVAFTDAEKTFVSEASVYRILKAEGLGARENFVSLRALAAQGMGAVRVMCTAAHRRDNTTNWAPLRGGLGILRSGNHLLRGFGQ